MREQPSYIKDSGHLIELMKSYKLDQGYIWVSLDVSALNTSIPNELGLEVLLHFLSCDTGLQPQQITFLINLVRFILTHNYFMFLEKYFSQTCGTAIGASLAPSFANLFMGYWESHFIWTNNPYSEHLVYFGCYIDDILLIWHGPLDVLMNFILYCNNNPFAIIFTSVIEEQTLIVLDLELSNDKNGDIIAKTHFKPTVGNACLHKKVAIWPGGRKIYK